MSALLTGLLHDHAGLGLAALIALVVGVLVAPGARQEAPDRADRREETRADRSELVRSGTARSGLPETERTASAAVAREEELR